MKLLSRITIYGALSMALLGSALGQNIQTDFDHHADFSQYKTYSWQVIKVADPLWDTRIKNAVNGQLAGKGWTQVDDSELNTPLVAKDSTQADNRPQFPFPLPPAMACGGGQAGNGTDFPFPLPPLPSLPAAALPKPTLACASSVPCVAIVAIQTTRNQTSLRAFYDGVGGGWGWLGSGGTGEATITPQSYKEGTLVIDMYDVKTKQLIWRGSAEGTLSDKAEKNEKKLENAVAKMFKYFPPNSTKH